MLSTLVIQVLGNSDIQVDGKPGAEQLQACRSWEDLREMTAENEKDLRKSPERVKFPLVTELRQRLVTELRQHLREANVGFGFLLTNQSEWVRRHRNNGDGWNEVATTDGCWWRNILQTWCDAQSLPCQLLEFPIDPDIANGVADWEGMARAVGTFLTEAFPVENKKVHYRAADGSTQPLPRLVIQHSSGTPALSSALYLWGIERKLEGVHVEFAYISKNKEVSLHQGNHWQWRLKVPQIQELLAVQDFSGALRLFAGHPNPDVENTLRRLDKAVSFNIADWKLSVEESVIERIAIARWSEQAFRQRGQWMHWYLRMAGAMELALLSYLVKFGHGFSWEQGNIGCGLVHERSTKPGRKFDLSVTWIASELLAKGQATVPGNPGYEVSCQPVGDTRWRDFVGFYCDRQRGWQLSDRFQHPFVEIRNNLYHVLAGDKLDELLDGHPQQPCTDPQHPSQIAVVYLHYLIEVAGLKDAVQGRVTFYRNQVQQVQEGL